MMTKENPGILAFTYTQNKTNDQKYCIRKTFNIHERENSETSGWLVAFDEKL